MSQVDLDLTVFGTGEKGLEALHEYVWEYHRQHMESEEKHKEELKKNQQEIEALRQENSKLRADLAVAQKGIEDVRMMAAQAIDILKKKMSDEEYAFPVAKYPILDRGLNYIDPDIKKMKKDPDSKMIDQNIRQKMDSDSDNSDSSDN